VLCKAIKQLPGNKRSNICLDFYGDDSEVDQTVFMPVKELSEEYDNVRIRGSVTHDKMLKVIAEADYIIIPSRKEPMPTVAVEAMMLGTPCIISNVCGVTYYMENEKNALIFNAGDPLSLSKRLERGIEIAGKEEYEMMRKAAREKYEVEFEDSVFEERVRRLI
jgi:glycosyltransferase involved in cell wall biosynthesis